MKKCLILANGRPPRKSVINHLRRIGYTHLICADGGADSAKKLDLTPDIIIGDLDSVKESTLKYFKDKSKVIKFARQNDTDVEKCLKYAIKNKFEEAILLGVTGNRLDHTFCNLGIVIKYFERIYVKIIAENSFLSAYRGHVKLKTQPGETFSLYGFDKNTKISSKGLKYPLKNTSLPFGERESTSNIAIKNDVVLNVKGGVIFIVRDYNVMKNNDFL